MNEKIRRKARELLSEPFTTNYGFCYACANMLQKLNPKDRLDFLKYVLEKYSLVEKKAKLTVLEHNLEEKLLDDLLDKHSKDLQILLKGAASVFSPTEELATYLLAAMEIHPQAEDRAIILWYFIENAFLPYAPRLPEFGRGQRKIDETVKNRIIEKRAKEAAIIARLVNFETNRLNIFEISELLLKSLPQEELDRQILMAFFVENLIQQIYAITEKMLIQKLFQDNLIPNGNQSSDDEEDNPDEEDDEGDADENPPKKGNGTAN